MSLTAVFTARTALCPLWVRVDGHERFCDLDPKPMHARVLGVFQAGANGPAFVGLIPLAQAALENQRSFAELAATQDWLNLPADTPLSAIRPLLQAGQHSHAVVMDANGEFVGILSEYSLAEKLLLQQQAELQRYHLAHEVFQATSEGIMVIDPQLRIVQVNPAFTETTGYTAEEALGQTPRLLASGRHDPAFYAEMWQALNERGAWSGEIWNRRRNGEVYPEWLNINVIRNAAGEVQNYVGVFSDVTHFKSIQDRLHELAFYDPLTNLPNRKLLYDRLEQAVMRSRRKGSRFALLFIDLDRFKDVNDSLGHGFGDKILIEAANRLRKLARESDTVARLGGDEFTLILPDAPEDWQLAGIANRVLAALSQPIEAEGRKVFLSASVGIARYPNDGQGVEELLRHADTAMYRAKADGRNRFCFFTPELNEAVVRRLRLETELRESIQNGQLHVVWQPQVRLADRKPVGAEVLARWRHAELGDVPPSQFIPVAEECGLIVDLSRWVFEHALQTAAEWLTPDSELPMRIAINMSALHLRHENAADDVMRMLRKYRIDPNLVELELTESALMGRDASSEAFVQKLGAHGLSFAVDDFGTGYSNLAYLKRFTVHRLKIDRAFVQDITESAADRQIVAAIIAIGHSLGLTVVAEGVETLEQERILREMGCDEAQGYLYSRPIAFEELSSFLRQDMHCFTD